MEEQPEVSLTEQQPYTPEAKAPPEKKSRTGLIIGIVVGVVVLLFLCCCCAVAAFLLANWEQISQGISGGF
jgi:flagellar basal body-associated protein FliL